MELHVKQGFWSSFLLLMLAVTLPGWGQTPETLIYPKAHSVRDQRTHFPVKLLDNILRAAGDDKTFELRSTEFDINQEKALALLDLGRIHVVWAGTSEQREQNYRPIKIPLYKGYLGWRVMLLAGNNKQLLNRVTNAQQLTQFSLLSGQGWPEISRYQNAGFEVITHHDYETLFRLTAEQKVDLFPRSVMEIWQEKQNFSHLNLAIDPNLIVKYPLPLYYFVSNNNPQLAQRIQRGFAAVIKSGWYDDMFEQAFGDRLRQLDLGSRREILLSD